MTYPTHIEFFDLSSNDFGEMPKETVEFTGSDGTIEKMDCNSPVSVKVMLQAELNCEENNVLKKDNSISWILEFCISLEYTFYEDDILFFIIDEIVIYSAIFDHGDSGTLDVAHILSKLNK